MSEYFAVGVALLQHSNSLEAPGHGNTDIDSDADTNSDSDKEN